MSEYKLKPGKIGKPLIDVYHKMECDFTDAFLAKVKCPKFSDTLHIGKMGGVVVGVYKKIEYGVVGEYKKIENAFIDMFLEKDE